MLSRPRERMPRPVHSCSRTVFVAESHGVLSAKTKKKLQVWKTVAFGCGVFLFRLSLPFTQQTYDVKCDFSLDLLLGV